MDKSTFSYSDVVLQALSEKQPIVALESTVITHGLPYPVNFKAAMDMQAEVRRFGAVPATVAVIDGRIWVGLDDNQLESLAAILDARKVSLRDLAPILVQQKTGGTTVAATMAIANAAGIQVFATGGIGGVHRGSTFDISTDLMALGSIPIIVVCAGAKAILDLVATVEVLETLAVPVLGYQTDEFPAFYSRSSGLPVSIRVDTVQDAVAIAQRHWELGFASAVLVAQPPPEAAAMPREVIEEFIEAALQEATHQDIHGQAVTPFLLKRVSEMSGGSTMEANLELLINNARLGAVLAVELAK